MEIITKNYNPSMSDDTTKLAASILLAQDKFIIKKLSGNNTHTKKKYATIGDIYRAIKCSLKAHNIWVKHFSRPTDNGMEYIYTRLTHTLTGQFIEDCRIVESEKPGNQAKGSANTYMKRYALLSLCALDTDEDDDDSTNEAEHIAKGFISKAQYKELDTMLTACSNEKILYDCILKENKIKYLDELQAAAFEGVKTVLENNRKK